MVLKGIHAVGYGGYGMFWNSCNHITTRVQSLLHQLGAVLPYHVADHCLTFILAAYDCIGEGGKTPTSKKSESTNTKYTKHHKTEMICGTASCSFFLFSSSASQIFASCFRDFLCLNASLMKGVVASVAYHNSSATSRTASVVSNGGVPERPQRCVAPRDFITSRTRVTQDSVSWNSSSTILPHQLVDLVGTQ